MLEYRPLRIASACEPCRQGECWDCIETVVHPGNKRVAAGMTVTCACHAGHHQWKPQPVFPRRPADTTVFPPEKNEAP